MRGRDSLVCASVRVLCGALLCVCNVCELYVVRELYYEHGS
jgi:hypothetical protein